MTNWSTKTKTMRKVGDIWLDPMNVDAAEEKPSYVAVFYLHSGEKVETFIPGGKTLNWMMSQLFKGHE